MPNPNEYDNEDDFMAACVPMMTGEGRDQEQAVAACMNMWKEKSIDVDNLIYAGAEVKALGDGKVGGYLVRYGDPKNTDLEGDFFTAGTEFGITDGSSLPVYYNHGLDANLKSKRIGRASAKFDEIGLWLEAQLELRDEYEKMIYALAEQGKLGWSSGAAGHLVEREKIGKAWHIKSWPIAEGSLTPTPAEPRNTAVPIKSLITSEAESDKGEQKVEEVQTTESTKMDEIKEVKAIDDESLKGWLNTAKSDLADVAKASAREAVEEAIKALPEIKGGHNLEVTLDEGDRPFKSVAEQMLAQKEHAMSGKVDPRLRRINYLTMAVETGKPVKALLGSNETIPSQGEFLLEPTISAEFLQPIHEQGPLTSLARRMPVNANSVSGWINGVDETSRAVGSRWGGVRGYWLNEGDSMTASQPKFKRINWELHPLAVLQYATDWMLRDSALMDAVIRQSSIEELNFLVNDAFFRGTGAGQPKGLGTTATNPALISAVRTNATNIDHDDILRMKSRIDPKAFARMVWLANPDTMVELDSLTFTSGSTGILSPYVRYTEDGVMMLAGRPVIFNEFSPTLGSVGDILLWDPADYLYWEGTGIEGASSIHVQFLTNQTVFRFVYRVDGMPASYSALTRYQSTDTVSSYVALAATT